MKNNITYLLILLSFTVFAQDKDEVKEFFWGKNDIYRNINSIPDKWKNESAVIIYKYENHDYHNYRINVTYTSGVRKKIMLLDDAAVKEFSEFSFLDKIYSDIGYASKAGANILGVKIIKPNGSIVEIDVDKETKLIDNKKKLAIANLEVGDIIDFYLFSQEKFKSDGSSKFPRVERVLGDEYPIMNYKLNFLSENDFFINFNSYNGAPELKEVKAERSSDRKFELEAKNIEKEEFSKWLYPLVELPSYKFQVYFAKNGGDRNGAYAFLSDREKDIKKTVSKEEVFKKYKYFISGDYYYGGSVHEDPKKFFKDKKFASDEDKVRALYNYARYLYLIRPIELSVAGEANLHKEYRYMQTGFNVPFYSDEDFFNYFIAFLKNNNIDYDIILGTARYNGPIKDLLIRDNLTAILRVNTPNPLYLEYFTPFGGIEYLNPDFENSKAFLLKGIGSKKEDEIEEIVLPSTSVKDNISKTLSVISLNNDLTNFNVNREVSYSGHFKADEQKEKIPFYKYVQEDNKLYEVSKRYGIPKSKEEIEKKGMKALINKLEENFKEKHTNSISEEYKAKVEDYSLTILKSGRNEAKEPFQFKEEFKIKNDFIKKAGENYIIEIGKFLTSQIEIDKKEKDRKNDIYMPYPRAIENQMIFEIPQGYTVSGLDKLNKNVSNETGRFISSAVVKDNKLIIETSKHYNNYFEPNSNWHKMIQFLDAAYQFTQEKILLKKS